MSINPFRPGQFLMAQDIRNIRDGIKHRITGGKNINVFSSGNQIIIEKRKLKTRLVDDRISVLKHGGIFITPDWDFAVNNLGWDIDDWNFWVAEYKKYNKKGSRYKILTQGSESDLFPDVPYDSLPLDNITFDTILDPIPDWQDLSFGMTIENVETADCGGPGGGCFGGDECYNGNCYDDALNYMIDPNSVPDFDYWVFSTLDPFDDWVDYATELLDSIGTLESSFHIDTWITASRMKNSVKSHFENMIPWTWGGDGLWFFNRATFWLEYIVELLQLNAP